MIPDKDDFIVFYDDKRRKKLMQVQNVERNTVYGTLDANRAYEPRNGQCQTKDIICNLGPHPAPGSSYGVNIEPYFRTLRHPDWGDIHLFTRITKDQGNAIMQGLARSFTDLKKAKLDGLIEAGNLVIELRPPKAKNRGMYYYRQRGQNAEDRMMLRVQEFQEPDLYREVANHEMGHALTWRGMTRKMQSRWVRLYEEFCQFTEHDANDVKRMGHRFLKGISTVKAFRSTLEDEEAVLFDTCLSQIAADYRLTAKDIDLLIESENIDMVKQLWPTGELRYSEFEEALGDYATKKWTEFLAEAFRLHFTKTEIPQRVKELMEKSIKMGPTLIGRTDS